MCSIVPEHPAGHSDMRTTQRYYLLVQPHDLQKARAIQASLLGPILEADLADPKVADSRRKRLFPGPRGYQKKQEHLD